MASNADDDDDDDDTDRPNTRYSDIPSEPSQLLLPIEGYQTVPLLPLDLAIKPVDHLIDGNIKTKIYIARKNCEEPKEGLDVDESAAVQLYTMECVKHEESLYYVLNQTLRMTDRSKLKPWFAYLRLLLTALWKLPSHRKVIWRGINGNLSNNFVIGKDLVWWGFSSCTQSLHVLEKKQFLGKTGIRTLFNIECITGKIIKQHSFYKNEDEILLMPATQFRIVGKVNQGELNIIHLKELENPEVILLNPPFSDDSNVSTSTALLLQNTTVVESQQEKTELSARAQEIIEQLNSTNKNERFVLQIASSFSLADAQAIGEALKENKSARELCIRSSVNVAHEIIERILYSMTKNNTIAKLSLDGSKHCSIVNCGQTLAQILRKNKSLKSFNICYSMLTDEAIEMITVALENNKSLEKLVIEHHQQLTSQSAIALAHLLKANSSTLIALTLNATSIGDEGSQSIAKALKTNRSLKKLFLTDCRITDIGVIGLNESLKVNATLEVLNLNENQINNSGALIIADGLKENRSLKHVFIRGNKFSRSDEGGKALLSAAQNRLIELIF